MKTPAIATFVHRIYLFFREDSVISLMAYDGSHE